MWEIAESEKEKDYMLNISTPNRPNDRERSPRTAPSTYDTAGRLQHTQSTVGKCKNEHNMKNAGENPR